MMVESLRPDLAAHRGAPDKTPERRLATLEWAGELGIPFTTGILVGIGESEADRLAALEAIAASHRRHGHVQEVIVQNFLPKPGTTMRDHPACPPEEHVRAISLARLVLPAEVHVQAPPNLSDLDRLGDLLDAGIDDWGGVSPVTPDHVNPERPWPAVDVLRGATEARGLVLAPRLTVYPEFAAEPDRWLDPATRFPVLDRSDAESLGRDDPGATWPERHQAAANVGTGAEVVQIGRRSTAWYSGADIHPPTLLDTDSSATASRETRMDPQTNRGGGAVAEVLAGVRAGQEVGEAEIVTLFGARGPEVAAVAEVADDLRRKAVGDTVTYVVNRNINYTNVCTFRCTFCGFSKGPLSLNLRGAPYLLSLDEVAARAVEAAERGATEVCLQGGIHPSFDGDFYLDVLRAVKTAVPGMHVHGFTALEVTEGAKRLGEPLAAYLTRLKDAGLGSLPGTAAEILDDEVRAVLCPDKVNTEEWLEAHRVAHAVGLRSNITIMFGSVETPLHWARHLIRTRDLQKQTGGFTEFVPLPFVHMAAPIYLKRAARRGPTWRESVLMHAVARIAYDGWLDNIQASWVKLGQDGARQLLAAGVNDLGGTLMDENISRAAGAAHGQLATPEELHDLAASAGRTAVQRTTLYGPVTTAPTPTRTREVG
jgi:FO synthase